LNDLQNMAAVEILMKVTEERKDAIAEGMITFGLADDESKPSSEQDPVDQQKWAEGYVEHCFSQYWYVHMGQDSTSCSSLLNFRTTSRCIRCDIASFSAVSRDHRICSLLVLICLVRSCVTVIELVNSTKTMEIADLLFIGTNELFCTLERRSNYKTIRPNVKPFFRCFTTILVSLNVVLDC
jgi:hypothetical protein